MDTYNRLHLADREALHERVIRAVVEQVRDAEFVLNGGGAGYSLWLASTHHGHRIQRRAKDRRDTAYP